MTPIVTMFGEVVEATKNNVIGTLMRYNSLIETVGYMYGHPTEIMNRLMEMEKTPGHRKQKFPAIILFQDFTEQMGNSAQNYGRATLNIAIVHATNQAYKASERYQYNFTNILYPIYDELMRQIANYQHFNVKYCDKRNIEHTKTDRLFWGKNGLYGSDGSKFGDYIDAIEIENLNLTITNKTC